MSSSIGRGLSTLALAVLIYGQAGAQTVNTPGASDDAPQADALGSLIDSTLQAPSPLAPYTGPYSNSLLASAINAARRGDSGSVQNIINQMSDPVAKKVAFWAMVDADGEQLSFYQLDQARRDFVGWPHPNRRQTTAEKAIAASGLDAQRIVDWFGGQEPQSAEGAMALAGAYEQLNRRADAQDLIRRWWSTKTFELGAQTQMMTRFSDLLTPADYAARTDMLLYGVQGPAARALIPLLPADQQALARARIALRENASNAANLVNDLPQSVSNAPGLAVEHAHYLLKRNLETLALGMVANFPVHPPGDDAASRIWTVRKPLINAAMKAGQYRAAYAAATDTGLAVGTDYTEAEFYAGWIALCKLHDAALADQHFAAIERAGATPITRSRALYWRGRAAEARGDASAAQAFYLAGAKFQTAFYGQLAAEKAGLHSISLGSDPLLTPDEHKRFEADEVIRATRMLGETGERDLFRSFVLSVADTADSARQCAMLVDLASGYGDQDLAMRAVRSCAQHGFVLPERGYPLRAAPIAPEAAEAAIVFGVTRQESGFDPRVRSGPGARGMMQLMPATAQTVARNIGEPYQSAMLDNPDYNMRLGAAYLGHMINNFSGSYVLAAAAYNAGPGRPAEWVSFCGDPRTSSGDPVDFIECIPFSETRNYVMRVLEATQVYRARINGGTAPITLTADLKRGGYVPSSLALPTVAAYTPAASSTAAAESSTTAAALPR
ncbi:MAG TPA: lytic transglycosylase domain-containing protein [Caulobacteraceae bacterium]|nr:lytic transglycosylase domain-containing protein [Caulobacteraceae bacterium]